MILKCNVDDTTYAMQMILVTEYRRYWKRDVDETNQRNALQRILMVDIFIYL